jgi:hypothetical protein
MLTELAQRLGVSQTAVITLLIKERYEKEFGKWQTRKSPSISPPVTQ